VRLFFPVVETVIKKENISDFVNAHRVWLHQFSGFQTHVAGMHINLQYAVNEEGLQFFSDATDRMDHPIDVGAWIYVPHQGFYMKKEGQKIFSLYPGLFVVKRDIATFIASHKEELLYVEHFFIDKSPIETIGLYVTLSSQERIIVRPHIVSEHKEEHLLFFQDYVYVIGQGFYELGSSYKLPKKYRQQIEIPKTQEAFFLQYEIEKLQPFILFCDPKLQKPTQLKLHVRNLIKETKKRKEYWIVDLYYQSNVGIVDILDVWEALGQKKPFIFSAAGVLSLKDARFTWLRQLKKRRLHRKHKLLKLTTLEWIRLCMFENIQQPIGSSLKIRKVRSLMQNLSSYETRRLLDLHLLQSTLRPYQEVGVQWLWYLYCHGLAGILCDDMGLGKTHQAMALLAAVVHEDTSCQYKYLVVCPTSVIYHWQDLLERFLPSVSVVAYHGLERSLKELAQCQLLLTSYGILRTGREEIDRYHFELAIFDEIQIAKNPSSQTHAELSKIKANMKLGLTGTPIENRLKELKALFDIVLPGYLPLDKQFREEFIMPIEKHHDVQRKQLLFDLIKPFILRRKKQQVLLDLPEKTEEIAYCDLSSEQQSMYKEVLRQGARPILKDLLNKEQRIPYIHIFALLTKLKRICDHPSLILEDFSQYMEHESGKWDLFVQLLSEARDSHQKVVVFSQYLEMLGMMEKYLKKQKIGYAIIKGSTKDRKEPLQKFRDDPKCEVFLASLLAAGIGIDLSSASIVIHYDRWWNPAREDQATDRVHRIGQSRGVQVFKLVTKHTIEEDIHALISKKRRLIEEIIDREDADEVKLLSREELIDIFQKSDYKLF
jgi:SNF2 family DNA or RNA helicase